MGLGQWLVIVLSIFLICWFIIGAIINRRHAQAIYDWLQAELLSEPQRVQWNSILRSMAYLQWNTAPKPYRSLNVFITLAPLENFPLWLFRRLKGQGDELYMRAELLSIPAQEVEIGLQSDPSLRAYLASQSKEPYTIMSNVIRFEIARRGKLDPANMDQWIDFLSYYEKAIVRLSLRRKSPHLMIRMNIPSLQTEMPANFFKALRAPLE